MTRRALRRALVIAVAPIVFLAACGGDDEHGSGEHGSGEHGGGDIVAPSADAIVIEVDGDTTSPSTETVPLGSTVSLQITSSVTQEFHLHDYDVEGSGTSVTLTFVADEAGSFELESHDTEQLLLTLVVE
jgi:hypothetical protein